MTLHTLFPDEDHRFSMRLERGHPAAFYCETPDGERLLAERRQWLHQTPDACLAVTPEAGPLVAELTAMAGGWLPAGQSRIAQADDLDAHAQCLVLGQRLEPDFLLLSPDRAGVWRLRAGCVCFPSSWALEEKIGHPLEEIHSPVPGLNAAVGPQIARFLSKLSPGVSWQRSNWGLSRSAELNQHPRLGRPRLDDTVSAGEVFLRIEHQSLVALPQSGGVLFGIRIEVQPLSRVLADPRTARGLERALRTMPEPVAGYKGLAPARARLLEWLQTAT